MINTLSIKKFSSKKLIKIIEDYKLYEFDKFLEKDLKNLESSSKPKSNKNTTTLNTLAGYRNKLFK